MKRRSFLLGGTGVAIASALILRPKENGGPHNHYFSKLNDLLKKDGPANPSMLIDLDRMNSNIDSLSSSVGPNKKFRVVVKSLPSVELVKHVMHRANTKSLMLFHQPFINLIAKSVPDADVLIGKPLPVNAAERFYLKLQEDSTNKFNPETQLQWLVDTPKRFQQYRKLAQKLGIKMQINLEIDLGLHRGGFSETSAAIDIFESIKADAKHLVFSGFMGYEPHLSGSEATLADDSVQAVLNVYREFVSAAELAGYDSSQLTLNGAGSHTLGIYEDCNVMNDLSAGSGILKPSDFDTYHLRNNQAALFIATPILKRYDELKLPLNPLVSQVLSAWNPNMRRLYFIYGGYWKAKFVSPSGVPEPVYHSTNQEPVATSVLVDLQVDDYMFLRPTQSEHVMLQFGDLLVFSQGQLVRKWPVFQETG
ncbi:MAG: D-serine deaminase-like pyridoxal phosphate-dependent protein [Candidatus Azotimanducaceae bacterium]|jgi:D-serine deaminase-like pyridoxal phosphate-dependent protein